MADERLAIDRLMQWYFTEGIYVKPSEAFQRVAEECARIAEEVANNYPVSKNLAGQSPAAEAIRKQFRLGRKM